MLHERPKDAKAPPQPEKKPKRFRLVRLEERIAPRSNKLSNKGSCVVCFTF